MAFTAFRTWVASEVLTAALLNTQVRDNGLILKTSINDDGTLASLQSGRLTSNQTWTTDTTLADITGLSFTIAASEVWAFISLIHLVSPGAADIKFDVTAPSGASGRHGLISARNEIGDGSATIGTIVNVSTVDSTDLLHVHGGTIVNSTNAGTVQVQAAQNNSSGTTTIYANSSVIAVRL